MASGVLKLVWRLYKQLSSFHANKGKRGKSWRYSKKYATNLVFSPSLLPTPHPPPVMLFVNFLLKFFIYCMNFGFYTSFPPGYFEIEKLRMGSGAAVSLALPNIAWNWKESHKGTGYYWEWKTHQLLSTYYQPYSHMSLWKCVFPRRH